MINADLGSGEVPRIGVLILSEANKPLISHSTFVHELVERGWVPRRNMVLEYRFARGDSMRDKFKLVVNLKTAKAFGLTIPQSILVKADEVIR